MENIVYFSLQGQKIEGMSSEVASGPLEIWLATLTATPKPKL